MTLIDPVFAEVVRDIEELDIAESQGRRGSLYAGPAFGHLLNFRIADENDEGDYIPKDFPEMYRTVLILRDVQHLSIKETAKVLGLSEANVKTRLLPSSAADAGRACTRR
jgi:Sigma-70, region 4